VVGSCDYGDESSGSCATELVSFIFVKSKVVVPVSNV
jgi:hypothetical protein